MKQKKTNNNYVQENVTISSIRVVVFEANGVKVAKASIKGLDLDNQIEFKEPLRTTHFDPETHQEADIYYDVRFTRKTGFDLNPYKFDNGFYKLVTSNCWIDTRPDNTGKQRYILRVGDVQKFEQYYKFKDENKKDLPF